MLTNTAGIVVGVDAANIRYGGARTHLIELLSSAVPSNHNIKKIIVYCGKETSLLLPNRSWLDVRMPSLLEGGILKRTWWQRYHLSKQAHADACDILLIPGGSYSGSFRPFVAISQTMLPFEPKEAARYGLTPFGLKLILLRRIQAQTFANARGVIFLSEYARTRIRMAAGLKTTTDLVIPHGLSARFKSSQNHPNTTNGQEAKPKCMDVLYVSHSEPYKHQWHVIKAIHDLRKKNYDVRLTLAGLPGFSYHRLLRALNEHDPRREWVTLLGDVPHREIHKLYKKHEIGLFASSCENLPITLLEMMGSGLKIACSDRGPMPEVLGNAGIYFDPETPESITKAIEYILRWPDKTNSMATLCTQKALNYSWEVCATQTLKFISTLAIQ